MAALALSSVCCHSSVLPWLLRCHRHSRRSSDPAEVVARPIHHTAVACNEACREDSPNLRDPDDSSPARTHMLAFEHAADEAGRGYCCSSFGVWSYLVLVGIHGPAPRLGKLWRSVRTVGSENGCLHSSLSRDS